nr:uncharacterized protein LOC100178925 isoform X2 [Ciona intestinalis]|eukprot:XP_018667534.1 uncharacterized protein LOC100178925 isoform X2 [Ciona intestinalis]
MGYRASVTVNVKAPFNTSSVGPAERETCTHPRVDIWAKNVYNSQASMDASPLNREARHTDERTRTANSKRRTRKNNTKRRPQFELRNSYSNKRTSAVLPNLQSILNSPKTDPTSTPTPNPQFRNEFPRRLRQRRGITADNSSWTRLRHFCDSEPLSTAGTKFSLFREIADELDSGLNEDPRLPETDHVKEPIISILAVDINADFNDPELLHRLRQLLFHISFTKLNNGSLNIGSTLVNASLNGTVAVAVSNSELNKAITVGREEKDAGMRFLPSHMLIVIIGCFSLLALIATVACVVKRRRTRSRRTQQQQEQGIDDNESQKFGVTFSKLNCYTCCCYNEDDNSSTMSVASDRRINNNLRPPKIQEPMYKAGRPGGCVWCTCCRGQPNRHVTTGVTSQHYVTPGRRSIDPNRGTSSLQHNSTPNNFLKYNRITNNPYRHDTYPPNVSYPSTGTLAEPGSAAGSPGSVRSHASRRPAGAATEKLLTPRSNCIKPPPNRTHIRCDNIVIAQMRVEKTSQRRCPLHSSTEAPKPEERFLVPKPGDECRCDRKTRSLNACPTRAVTLRTWDGSPWSEPFVLPAFDPNHSIRDGRRPPGGTYGSSPPEYSEPPDYFT